MKTKRTKEGVAHDVAAVTSGTRFAESRDCLPLTKIEATAQGKHRTKHRPSNESTALIDTEQTIIYHGACTICTSIWKVSE
jgi:hypothetical protein